MTLPSVALAEVCSVSMGQAPDGETYNDKGDGLPLIAGAGDFGDLSPEPSKFTTAPSKISAVGDIILCIRATIGDRNWSDQVYCLGRGVAGLRAKAAVLDQEYLWHWLGSATPELKAKGRGATFLQVNKADINTLQIPLPPLPEQRRIAAILDKADALRAKRRLAIAKLDQLLQSAFLEMFGDPVTNPKGWRKSSLNSVCQAIVDCPHTTPNWTDDGVVCLRTSNLTKGGWDWSDKRFVTENEYQERSKRSEACPGDIILSREGTVGVAAIVEPGMRVCMGQRLVQVRPDLKETHPNFLLQLLLYDLAPVRIERLMVGSTAKHLNVKDLRELKIFVPPIALQQKFSDVASRLKIETTNMGDSMDQMDGLSAGLQSLLFSDSPLTAA